MASNDRSKGKDGRASRVTRAVAAFDPIPSRGAGDAVAVEVVTATPDGATVIGVPAFSDGAVPDRVPIAGPDYFLPLSPGALSEESAAMKASWGTSTRPTIFIRFLPSFCFSSSFRLRVMSPP